MKQINKVQAFTLIELIVVITILAILGTIAFISLQGFSASARDSRRISDISNIKKSLELFSINTGKYPLADEPFQVLYNGELVWTQGLVGDNVSTNLSRNLNKKPVDPLTEQDYVYSTTQLQTQYEVLGIYESDLISYNNLSNQINASNLNTPKISGNYNGVYVKTDNYYVPTPTIINAELNGVGGILDDENIRSQIITGGDNNITNGTIPLSIRGLDGLSLETYTGTITNNSDDSEKILLAETFIAAYSGCTDLTSDGIYKQIVETELIDTGALISLVDDIVLSSMTYVSNGGGDDGGETITYYTNIDGSQTPYLPGSANGSDRFEFDSGVIPGGTSIVYDRITGLYWQSNGTAIGSINWNDAKIYCANLSLGGYDDWRLPDYTELQTIVDYSIYNPSIDISFFTIDYSVPYRTSTSYGVTYAWCISFNLGYGDKNSSKLNLRKVRCVR